MSKKNKKTDRILKNKVSFTGGRPSTSSPLLQDTESEIDLAFGVEVKRNTALKFIIY